MRAYGLGQDPNHRFGPKRLQASEANSDNDPKNGCEDFEAEFREAKFAISGNDWNDARQALLTEILGTFEMLLDERNLCPPATEQLQVLRTYIERA